MTELGFGKGNKQEITKDIWFKGQGPCCKRFN